jgi:hypothetical protein
VVCQEILDLCKWVRDTRLVAHRELYASQPAMLERVVQAALCYLPAHRHKDNLVAQLASLAVPQKAPVMAVM